MHEPELAPSVDVRPKGPEPALDARSNKRGPLAFRLSPGITRGNVLTYFGGAFLGLMLISLSGSLTPYVLTHLAHVDIAEQGRRSGLLMIYNEVVMLPAILALGVLSDRIGRRSVYAWSFVFMALLAALTAGVTGWTTLVIASLVGTVGSAGQSGMMSTVIADYTEPEDRGKAIAVMGMTIGLGAVIGALVLARMPLWFSELGFDTRAAGRATFAVMIGIALLTALWMRAGLSAKRPVHHDERPALLMLARDGVHAARDPKVLLAYLAGFVSRCDMLVLGVFLTLWVNKAAHGAGLSPEEATAKAGMMFGISQTAAWLTGAFIAILFDRVSASVALAISLFIAGLGYGAVLLVGDALGVGMILGAAAVGVGQIASLLGSQAYVAKVAPAERRGSVIGVFGFCGAVGTLLAAIVGGELFDRVSEASPFALVGGLSLVLAAVSASMRARKLV